MSDLCGNFFNLLNNLTLARGNFNSLLKRSTRISVTIRIIICIIKTPFRLEITTLCAPGGSHICDIATTKAPNINKVLHNVSIFQVNLPFIYKGFLSVF